MDRYTKQRIIWFIVDFGVWIGMLLAFFMVLAII